MRVREFKKFFCFLMVIIFIFSCFLGCSPKEALPLNDIVKTLLETSGIKNSKILSICEPSNETVSLYSYTAETITDEQLQKFVDDTLLVHEKMIEITDRNIVKMGDAIIVSYIVYYNSQIVASAENEPLLVGAGNYFDLFENAVVGAQVGVPFTCNLKSPVDTEQYKKGDILQYNITIKSINYFESYKSSDKYILDYYGVNTQEEFISNCKLKLQQIKEYENVTAAHNKFLNEIAKICEFYIDKEEAATYSKKIVNQHKDLAYIQGLELNDYIDQTLNMSEDEFYDYCYDVGISEIKQMLIVGARSINTTIDNNEYFIEFCSMYGYDSTQVDNIQVQYEFLKVRTALVFMRRSIAAVAVYPDLDLGLDYTVKIYDSSNIQNINFSTDEHIETTNDLQAEIISIAKKCQFGLSPYSYAATNNLYDTVLVFKSTKKDMIWLIDQKNGYIKWIQNDGETVCCKLPKNLMEKLINIK